MIIILSPSKTLSKIEVQNSPKSTQPQFIDKSTTIVERLRKLSIQQLTDLMGISKNLAQLNYQRYLQWKTPFDHNNSYPAILSFKGDVYEGLSVNDFTKDDLLFAQNHLRILSGLYGALRPLDLMQEYRLEMGTKIDVKTSKNLYEYWQKEITNYINKELEKEKILVNLASNEYSKVIDLKKIKGTIIAPTFKEQKGGAYKTVAIHAKRARGLMTRFIIKNRIEDVDHIKAFSDEGYIFSEDQSNGNSWVFIR